MDGFLSLFCRQSFTATSFIIPFFFFFFWTQSLHWLFALSFSVSQVLSSISHCPASSQSSYSFEESSCLLRFASNPCHKSIHSSLTQCLQVILPNRRTLYAQNNLTKFFSSICLPFFCTNIVSKVSTSDLSLTVYFITHYLTIPILFSDAIC